MYSLSSKRCQIIVKNIFLFTKRNIMNKEADKVVKVKNN